MTQIIKIAWLAVTIFIVGCGYDLAPPGKKYALGTVNIIDKNIIVGGLQIKQILINQANQVAYVLTDPGVLYHVDLSQGLTAMLEPQNWRRLKLRDPKKANTVGQSRLDYDEVDPEYNRQIYPTKDGILVKTVLEEGLNLLAALAYFEKTAMTPTYAWIESIPYFRAALATEYQGQEYFLVDYVGTIRSVVKGQTQFKGAWDDPDGGSFTTKFVLAADENNIFVVESKEGINVFKKSLLGQDSKATVIASSSQANKWQMISGVANSSVRDAVCHAGKLYIALETEVKNITKDITKGTGGVVVYDINTQKVTAPSFGMWNQRDTAYLRVEQGQVLASVVHTHDNDGKGPKVEEKIGIKIISDLGAMTRHPLSLNNFVNNQFVSEQVLQAKTFVDGKVFYDNVSLGMSLAGIAPDEAKITQLVYLGKDYMFAYDDNASKTYVIVTHEEKSLKSTGL